MRRLVQPTEDVAFRTGVATLGGVLLASAALAASLACEQMASLGTICGADPTPNCGWCYGAASLALSGLAAITLALRLHREDLAAA